MAEEEEVEEVVVVEAVAAMEVTVVEVEAMAPLEEATKRLASLVEA